MNEEKIVRILREIARYQAPHILNNQTWQSDEAGKLFLASSLAHNDCLVLLGYLPPSSLHQTNALAQQWTRNFLNFYDLFAQQLFRTLSRREIKSQSYDAYQIAVLKGDARDLIIAMANYLVPYLDVRTHGLVSADDSQIEIVLREMLGDLGGKYVNADTYDYLLTQGTVIINEMVKLSIYQKSLTEFKKRVIYVKSPPPKPPPNMTGSKHHSTQPYTPAPTPPVKRPEQAKRPQPEPEQPVQNTRKTDYTLETFEDDTGVTTAPAEQETEQNTQRLVYRLIPGLSDKDGKESPDLPLYLRNRKNRNDDDKGTV